MTPLAEKIRRRIQQRGPISCRQFMETALYDPEQGYYTRHSEIGSGGDYYTSSHIHPLFGELLAHKFAALLADLEETTDLTIVEVGAGTGQLAQDVLTCWQTAHPRLYQRACYVISELSPAMRLVQQQRLREFSTVRWRALTEFHPASVRGIIFSNELIDAFPVHRLIRQGGQLRELLVEWRGGRFGWIPGDLTSEALKRFVRDWGITLEEGQIVEVNLNAIDYLRLVSLLLAEGYLVTIDYGELRPRLYASSRRSGTLRCFYKHTISDNPFVRIGEQDITASVDFTLLIDYGQRVGLRTVEFKRQREFLFEQGLIERLGEMSQQGSDALGQLKSLLAAKRFLLPGTLGDHFKLLIQRKRYG